MFELCPKFGLFQYNDSCQGIFNKFTATVFEPSSDKEDAYGPSHPFSYGLVLNLVL
jgi:hypothetical protein